VGVQGRKIIRDEREKKKRKKEKRNYIIRFDRKTRLTSETEHYFITLMQTTIEN
jgi:hypothetical protein